MADKKSSQKDVGDWKNISTKSGNEIPPLASNPFLCSCKYCKAILKETEAWTQTSKEVMNMPIKIGDRVLIQSSLPGVVKYIGDLDTTYTNGQIYIGVKLDDPVGEHDGMFNSKRFFKCPNMHGVIVPIEDVHLLVPADGRTITVNKPSRFLSMPEYGDLDSLASMVTQDSTGSCVEDDIVLQTMSESRLSTPLPEYNFNSVVTEAPSVSRELSENTTAVQKQLQALDGGVTRSGVFFCDAPGSITAGISSSDPDSKFRDELLKSLSQNLGNAPNKANIEDITDKPTKEVPPTPAPSAVNTTTANKSRPLSSSMSTMAKRPVAARNTMGSKSMAATVRYGRPGISKLVTNTMTASTRCVVPANKLRPKLVTPTTSSVKKAEPKSVKSAEPIPGPEPKPENAAWTEPTEPEEPVIDPIRSFTNRLLSSLPYEDAMTPLSDNAMEDDARTFQNWVEAWGGGVEGFTKANTLQKLIEAHRKGVQELEWQRKVDALSKNEKFGPRVRSILNLQNEILKVRELRKGTTEEIEQLTAHIRCSSLRKEINRLKDTTQKLHEENNVLIRKIRAHPMYPLVEEAMEQLGIEFVVDNVEFDSPEEEL